jgi:hypothetical protein
MRFAYIDSHGNEVPIPSVDALALRIELGAIGPDTKLYDAQADRWGAASTHEIFHTLARDSQADGFVAPPPPVAPPPSAPAPAAKAAPKPKPELKSGKAERAAAAAAASADLGLTLAAPAPAPEPPPRVSEPEPVPSMDLPLDLAPPMETRPAAAADPGPSGGGMGGMGGSSFDYGDLGTGLQLEDAPMDMGSGIGGGMTDAPMQFGGPPMGGGGDIQLEQPMSEFSPDSPPGWMAGPSDGAALDLGDAPAAPAQRAAAAPAADAPSRPRREPKDRPSTPKFKSQRSLAGPIITVVVLAALGLGGYRAWPLVQARLNPPEVPVRPAVVMPSIPSELLPTMRSLAEGAIAAAIAEADAATIDATTPLEPDQQWLGGQYFADASQFPGVVAFWTGVDRFIDGVRAGEWQLYHDKMLALASAQGIAADTTAMLVERADSGFVATAEAREAAYATVDRLVEASLGLHEFLIANEANIEYRPASTSTADPILEAVPNTTALGDQMLERVDQVTEALSEIVALDRVTRARLASGLTERLT